MNLKVIVGYITATLVELSTCFSQTIDYNHEFPLNGIRGVERGYVHYHAQVNNYGRKQFLSWLKDKKIPHGSTVMFDAEPWVEKNHKTGKLMTPWYGDATDDENMKFFTRYGKLIRELSPTLIRRRITIAIYGPPILLQRNHWRIWRDETNADYLAWRGDQVRVILQAEQSGFLPALRGVGGHVDVVGYLTKEWAKHEYAPQWVRRMIDNVDEVCDEYDVPHRWLWKADGQGVPLSDEVLRVIIEKTHGRSGWWHDPVYPAMEQAGVPELVKIYRGFEPGD